jgi:hypothetical protein
MIQAPRGVVECGGYITDATVRSRALVMRILVERQGANTFRVPQ